MFPLRDDNPTLAVPVVTIAIVLANVLAWALIQGFGSEPILSRSVCRLGMIPGELSRLAPEGLQVRVGPTTACVIDYASSTWLTPLTSMFLHGGWLHIIGNMWFLWVFGNNVEDSMGRLRFVVFYLLCGLAAAAAQASADPSSPIPMVGASGAIGGVMGAYATLYPRANVNMLVALGFYLTRIDIPAYLVLGYWFLLQLLGGIPALGGDGGGVAFWAHSGGFLTGAALSFLFYDPVLVRAHRRVSVGGGWG